MRPATLPRMLHLVRRPSETIRIGDDIAITVLSINPPEVRILVEAPENVHIWTPKSTSKLTVQITHRRAR